MLAMSRRRRAVLAAGAGPPVASARPSEHPAGTATAQAYYQFMLGRHFESEGETRPGRWPRTARPHASTPSRRRSAPSSPAFFARQGRVEDASREARAALALDPANHEANRILGSILASLAEPGDGRRRERSRAGAKRRLYLERGTPRRRHRRRPLARPAAGAPVRPGRQLRQGHRAAAGPARARADPRGVPAAGRSVERRGQRRRGGAGARSRRRGEPAPAGVARRDVRRAAAME